MDIDFFTAEEKSISSSFLENKYIITEVENSQSLNQIRNKIAEITAKHLNVNLPADIDEFLNQIHTRVQISELNQLRLTVISEMNKESWFRPAYFSLATNAINQLVGNELAMQRRINLSIQFPSDTSSLLPVHADVWAGDSAYEIVLWVPLVNCYKTKSMYITNAAYDSKLQSDFSHIQNKSSEDLFDIIKDEVTFLNIPYGKVLLFSQNVMHGNRVNEETETRWSMNCRFKSIMSPYKGKKNGEFFAPITIRPITRLGVEYNLPKGFADE